MKTADLRKLETGLLIATLLIVLFNSFQLMQIGGGNGKLTGSVVSTQATATNVIPTGTPEIYGSELGVSFDDVTPNDMQRANAAIGKLADLDRTIELEGEDLQRYIDILYNLEGGIACEYCCGAKSVIHEDGSLACGCAHSFAIRGLTKYLITNHGDEYTDEEILEEVGKWKTLFFPDNIAQKAQILAQNGIEINYINLASNKYRGIEKGAASGGTMVGGC